MSKKKGGMTKCMTKRSGKYVMISFRVPVYLASEFKSKHAPRHRSMVLRKFLIESLSDLRWLELQEVDLATQLLTIQNRIARMRLEIRKREVELKE